MSIITHKLHGQENCSSLALPELLYYFERLNAELFLPLLGPYTVIGFPKVLHCGLNLVTVGTFECAFL